MYPPLSEYHYSKHENIIQSIDQSLKASGKLEVPNIPKDFVYPMGLFYDTPYHLKSEGIKLRTEKIIQIISELNGRP